MDPVSRRLAALFAFGILAFFSPLLGAVNHTGFFLGIPVLPLYFFACWAGLVLLAAVLSRSGSR